MLPISPCGEFGDINNGRFLQSSGQCFASYRGKLMGEVTRVVVVVVVVPSRSFFFFCCCCELRWNEAKAASLCETLAVSYWFWTSSASQPPGKHTAQCDREYL